MKIEVEVTRADIDKGGIGDGEKCAVALAVKRAIKPYSKIKCTGVSASSIELEYKAPKGFEGDVYASVFPPKSVEKFIDKFDAIGGEKAEVKAALAKLQPFAFSLKVKDDWFPAAKEKSKKAKKSKKKGKK